MDAFVRLEPEGGVRAAARLAWSRSAPTFGGLFAVSSQNGHIEITPVYGQKGGDRGRWMDRFTKLNPRGGIRACVERAWKQGTHTNDEGLEVLAAAMAPLFEISAQTSVTVA
jgi:hypothetical protein